MARVKIKQDFIKRLETFNEQIERTGCKPSTRMLAFEVVTMPERVAAHFDMPAGEKCIYLHRVRFADADPIVTVETYLPYSKCAFVLDHDFSRESLYKVLAASEKTRICRVNRVLEAVAANSQDANLLDVHRGRPSIFSPPSATTRRTSPSNSRWRAIGVTGTASRSRF